MLFLRAFRLGAIVLSAMLVLGANGASASIQATSWVKGHGTQVRLVGGGRQFFAGSTRLFVGVHVRLDKGWHTYWRTPGDAGFSPLFDWSGSGNVRIPEVKWPVPQRIPYADGISIGYEDEVVFPVILTPLNPALPMIVKLKLDYAVCKEICVPAHAELTLKLPPAMMGSDSPGSSNIVSRYLARVPAAAAKPGSEGPALGTVKAHMTGKRPYLLVETVYPQGAEGADLFVEGPDNYFVPLPKRIPGGDDRRVVFKVDLSRGGSLAKLKGKKLRLTIVCVKGQSETSWRIP